MTRPIFPPSKVLAGLHLTDDDGPEGLSARNNELVEGVLWLAESTGASVRFLHVAPSASGQDNARIDGALGIAAAMATAKGISNNTARRVGEVWQEIVTEAGDCGAGVVALAPMAQARERLFGGRDRGKVIQRVVHHSPVDVWLVAPGRPAKWGRVLAPVALSDLGGQCIEAARGMRDLTDAEIIVLHSVTYPDDMSIKRTGDYEEALAAYHKKVRDEAFSKLHEMMGDDSEHFHLELAERAKIAELIPECAAKQNADIVLIGSTPQSKLVHFFMRGTEEKILGELDTSVWVLKPQDED